MNTYIEQIRQSIIPILQSYNVSKAALFGSIVHGQMQPGSDIDILVQIDSDISLLEFIGLKIKLQDVLNKKVDLVEYDMLKPLLRERILKEQEVIL